MSNLRLLRRAKGKFQSLRLYEHGALELVEAVDAGERVIKLRRFPRAMLSERLVYAAEVARGVDLENVNKRKVTRRKRKVEAMGDPSATTPHRKAGGR